MTKTTRNTATETPTFPDFSQFFTDYSRMFGDVTKVFGNGNAPTMDVNAVMANQRRNLEAVATMNRVAFECFQTTAQRQAEMARRAADEFVALGKALSGVAAPEEKAARQTALAREGFETAVANLRELGEMVQKSGNEAFAVLSKCCGENFDEVQAVLHKSAKKAA
jgi:phasin family protein